MSFAIASESIFSDRRLHGADVRLLLAILSHTRPNKPYCWPSRARLAECIGIKSHSRVSEILARLVDYGWLSIKRTGRSSLYTVHTPATTSDVHPVQDMEETSEYLEEENPLPLVNKIEPLHCNSVLEADTQDDTLIEQQPEPLHCNVILEDNIQIDIVGAGAGTDATTEQPTRVEEDRQVERVATSQHQDATEQPESVPAPAPAQSHKPDPATRHRAIQRVLDAFRQTSGIDYSNRPATERRIARRIAKYGADAVVRAIQAKGQAFRHPIAILKPSILESVLAEIEAETRARQETLRRDQAALDELRKGTGTRTREGALRGIQALKDALGVKPKPDQDGQLRA